MKINRAWRWTVALVRGDLTVELEDGSLRYRIFGHPEWRRANKYPGPWLAVQLTQPEVDKLQAEVGAK